MFVARSLVHGRMYGAIHIASEQRALAAMVGSMGLDEWGDDCMARMLVDAAGGLGGALDDEAPARLADALRSRLSVDGNPPDRPSWLFYAAALLRPGAIEVCHAGDLRVQLVQDDAVVHSTIDHTLGNRAESADAPQSSPLRNVVVRSLRHGDAPPERATWPFEGLARLVIASSEVHGHRPRDQPIPWPGDGFADDYSAGATIELRVLHRHGERTDRP